MPQTDTAVPQPGGLRLWDAPAPEPFAQAERPTSPVPKTLVQLAPAQPGRLIQPVAVAVAGAAHDATHGKSPDLGAPAPRDGLGTAPVMLAAPKGHALLSGSGWALVRGPGNPSLASSGALGGSQAGVRLNILPFRHDLLGLTARLTSPLSQSDGKEVALGVIVHPIAKLPISIIAEQRIALDRGGRTDAELIVTAGVYDRPVRHGLTLSAYAEAGMVGIKARDGFADGALELEHKLVGAGPLRLGASMGIWAAAQPGLARLDAGPELIAHAKVGPAYLRIAGGYRLRLAGNARPGSGPALAIGTSF